MTNDETDWSPGDPDAWKPPERRSAEDSSDTSHLDSMLVNYVLNERGEPVPEPDIQKWARGFEHSKRNVARTNVGGGYVSTIFLGIDHNFSDGPPILWETMVFGHMRRGLEFGQWRCGGSREQAYAMHKSIVRYVRRFVHFPKPLSRKRFRKINRQGKRRMEKLMKWIEEDRIKREATP